MKNDLEESKQELAELLYPEREITDNNQLQLALFKLLKNCLVAREYEFTIKNYKINLTPQNLSVIYEGDGIKVEVSNYDISEETDRELETRYFITSPDLSKEYYDSKSTSSIRVNSHVYNYNGSYKENIYLELFTNDPKLKLRDLLNVSDAYIEYDGDYAACIIKEISKEGPRLDIYDYLSQDKVIPVYLYEKENKFVPLKEYHKTYEPNNYQMFLPSQEIRKNNARKIYDCMIDYYNRYMTDNVL